MTSADAAAPRVEMRGITKRFGEVVALREVDFAARGGEIHGLLGENGAGKTTLMNVLSGLYRADAGEIRIGGRRVEIAGPRDALRHGIGMVHQHFELVPHLSGLENLLLGREGSRWWLRLDRHRQGVEDLSQRLGLPVDLDAPVETLPLGDQQKVEILKAMHRGAEVLILDEPTTTLTPQEVERLFSTIRTLARQGLTVVFITHKINEVLANCDRMTIMRAGAVVGTVERSEASEERLVAMMMGERRAPETPAVVEGADSGKGPVVLSVRGLTVTTPDGVRAVAECTFTVASRELVGVAGVSGNGQRELAEAIVGLLPIESGTIELGGRDVTGATVRSRMARGLIYIPEDRIADGLLPSRSVAENVLLGLHPYVLGDRVLYQPAAVHALAEKIMSEYQVRAPDEDALAINLSGGNIQKLLVSRALTLSALVDGQALVAMNPTRGIDVRVTIAIRRRLLEFRGNGGGVLLVSSDLDELMSLCDRILVMYRGRIAGDLPRADFDPLRIGHLMAGTRAGASE